MKKYPIQCKAYGFPLSAADDKAVRLTVETTSLLAVLLLLLLSPIMIAAQAVSGVTGVVTDPTGALVPGVQVVLTDTKTSRELTTTTNEDGVYIFNNVQPGAEYRLTFTAQGFQTLALNDVQLGIMRTETHNAQLIAGNVNATVEVQSSAGEDTLNTTDPSIGNVINQRQLQELPIQLRDNPAALIGLQPGVIGNNVGALASTANESDLNRESNRVGSVTGSRADQGNITVDGIDSNDVTTGQAFVTIGNLPIDSVQEFRAVTASPGASEGRSSGGQIQLATRSGTNVFHGSLREYFRTDKTAANSFFNNKNGIPRPKLQRHQFGGSLSGPLYLPSFGEGTPTWMGGKDRLFFFFDYEGRRDDSEASVTRTVPLQHLREGRIGYINNTCNNIPITQVRLDLNPQCISYLTPAQAAALDPRGIGVNQALLSFINSRYPQANDLTGGNGINTGLFRFNAPFYVKNNTYTTRIDGNISDTQRAFGRLTLTRNDQTNALRLFPDDEDAEKLIDKSYQLVGGHTWVISPSITNQATVGVSRQIWDFPPAPSAAYPNNFTFGPITDPYSDISFQNRDVIVPTFRDDMTWIWRSHTFQFGGQYKPIRQKSSLISDFNFAVIGLGGNTNALNASLRPGDLRPNSTTATTTFDASYAFLLGRLASLDTTYVYDQAGNPQPLASGRKRDYVYNEYELYVQDNWKVTSNLALNLGLRWHLYPAPYEKNGFQSGQNIDFQTLINTRVQNAAAGIGGDAAVPLLSYDLIGKENGGRPMYETDYNNLAPRLGFAYNPSFKNGFLGSIFGDRKTVIRGGASLVYDRVGGALSFVQDQLGYLFDNQASQAFGNLNPRTALLNDPRFTGINSLPVQNVAPSITRPFTPDPHGLANSQFNYAIDQNFEIPHSYTWSFGVQRELPGNLLLDVSYVGRRGRKLFAQSDASQIVDFRDPASGQFMLAAFNSLQDQLNAHGAITAIPWIENQVAPAAMANYGRTCPRIASDFLGTTVASCTELTAILVPDLIEVGGTADLVATLFANGLLNSNVGLGSQFAVNAYITNQGRSQYDGMLVSLQKRFSQGFQFDVNYTWSHAIDNQSSITNVVRQGLISNALDLNAGRGDADFDVRHLFNANGIWDLPFGRGRALGGSMPKWLDAIVGNWTLSGILSTRSGLPLTSYSGAWSVTVFSADNVGVPAILTGDRSVFKSNIRDEGTGIQYFADPAAVQAALRYPRHGEVGNRNIFRGPAFWNIDAAIAKRFKMPWSENHRLTIRAEAYNLTNSNFFGPPNLLFGSTTFGRITSSQSAPRELQFAIRYDF
ncbi:MAG: TonB-dependent receptor [Acidobacteriota bacterium]|nr:TonB-dependent receptor [Acidobacteriota bacterium]